MGAYEPHLEWKSSQIFTIANYFEKRVCERDHGFQWNKNFKCLQSFQSLNGA